MQGASYRRGEGQDTWEAGGVGWEQTDRMLPATPAAAVAMGSIICAPLSSGTSLALKPPLISIQRDIFSVFLLSNYLCLCI